MGTRSLTHVKNGDLHEKTLVTIYRQYDGYPSGIGADIYELFKNTQLLNGFGMESAPDYFNGMGCLAAYLVGHLKDNKIGNVYLYPADKSGCNEEYTYTIYQKDSKVAIMVIDTYTNKIMFQGLINEFGEWLNNTKED